MPVFGPLRCHECNNVVRGILFRCTKTPCRAEKPLGSTDIICEDCYRSPKTLHPRDHLLLQYKHCILRDVITPEVSRKICRCSTVDRHDTDGQDVSLFPVDSRTSHQAFDKTGFVRCGLLNLGELVAEAKYEGLVGKLNRGSNLSERKKQDEERDAQKDRKGPRKQKLTKRKMKKANAKAMVDVETALRERIQTQALVRDEEGAGVPFLLRSAVNRYPFGNVHMSLMFGPLRIENGVLQ